MPAFKYNIAPKSTGGFTTRAVKGNQTDSAALPAARRNQSRTARHYRRLAAGLLLATRPQD